MSSSGILVGGLVFVIDCITSISHAGIEFKGFGNTN